MRNIKRDRMKATHSVTNARHCSLLASSPWALTLSWQHSYLSIF